MYCRVQNISEKHQLSAAAPKPETTDPQKKRKHHWLAPPFKPGQSGNPGGRPKGQITLLMIARSHTQEAMETILSVMRTSSNHLARVQAAKIVLERGWGKPLPVIAEDATSAEATGSRTIRIEFVTPGQPPSETPPPLTIEHRPVAVAASSQVLQDSTKDPSP